MSSPEITPFKVAIPDDELDLVRKKLELVRFPTGIDNAEWAENNKVTLPFIRETVDFWLNKYDWREEERKINEMPQFKTRIEEGEFGTFDVHFVHARSDVEGAIPLIFIHGWPGSFIEVQKVLQPLRAAGFHVVAPSLLGYGFSSYTDKAGLNYLHQGEVFHKLMLKLGYDKYAVQGGDWGAIVGRGIALQFPDHAKILHTNLAIPRRPDDADKLTYTEAEKANMKRGELFREDGTAYQQVQRTRPRTLGFAMHDSPVGMLAWMSDKLIAWTDEYPWTPAERITWTLLHYFPGPTTGFNMYRENINYFMKQVELPQGDYVKVPYGFSAFAKEISIPPRAWVERSYNLVYWKDHAKGGHFAAWERPKEFVEDVTEFIKGYWDPKSQL